MHACGEGGVPDLSVPDPHTYSHLRRGRRAAHKRATPTLIHT